jgi:hypothetical protein
VLTFFFFRLGKGFNEDVMQRISKEGHGYFAYCKKSAQIPNFVGEALSQTQRIVGTYASLVLMGLGCAIVSKIYKHKNNIVTLNDLKQNNSVTIACKLKACPNQQTSDCEDVLKWRLTYTEAGTGTVTTTEGVVRAEFTSDIDVAQQPGDNAANACVRKLVFFLCCLIVSFSRFFRSKLLCLTVKLLLFSIQTTEKAQSNWQIKQLNIWKKQVSLIRLVTLLSCLKALEERSKQCKRAKTGNQ